MGMSLHGARTRAGQILSGYIRDVMEEETEFIKADGACEDHMATKAEYLAREICKRATGYTEEVTDSKGVKVELVHPPDKVYVQIVFDRMEGRAPQSLTEGEEKMTAAEKVTEQGVNRINSVSEDSAGPDNRT